jgi:two-component system, LytTR family, sensor histidine kinase AlgZ
MMTLQLTTARHEESADRDVLPREMLWVLAGGPPVLAALFWGEAYLRTMTQLLESLASIWIYTVVVGVTLHFGFSWLARVFASRGVLLPVRVAAYMTMTAAIVAGFTLVALPLLDAIEIASNVRPVSISVRAFVICALYLLIGTTLARFRARAVREALRADAQERIALEARFAALQARTNPHFLFNTLNAVASLIAIDAARAEQTLEKLASLFRYALDGAERRSVTLREEIDAVRDYLDIETTRFGDRLRAHVDLDPQAETIRVPPMIVQPLVENAIVHGLGGMTGKGNVWVSARCSGTSLVVSVEDDGVGVGGSTRSAGTGTALGGIRERLALAFGGAAQLETGSRAGGGFRAVIHVPMVGA